MATELVVLIDDDGTMQFVYTDELAELLEDGDGSVCRASHVEPHPTENGWLADMRPSGGPVLGANGEYGQCHGEGLPAEQVSAIAPFRTRAEALAAERAWLTKHKGL